MNVDTGQFQAITAQLGTLTRRLDALEEGLCRTFEAAGMVPPSERVRVAYRLGWDAGLRRGRTPDPDPDRPRRARPRHLRRIK